MGSNLASCLQVLEERKRFDKLHADFSVFKTSLESELAQVLSLSSTAIRLRQYWDSIGMLFHGDCSDSR